MSNKIEQMATMSERHINNLDKRVPLWEKYLLTIKEASLYFNIGENKLYRIAAEHLESDSKFVIQNGGRTMINRRKFEDFLNNSTAI